MFTHKDIENRSLFVINGLEHQSLKVSNGRLLLEDNKTGKPITKLPFPKILGLMIIGHITITTPLIEHCNKNGIPIVVMKPNFRPVFYFGNMAEANYLLRKKQYEFPKGNLEIAKQIISNKFLNQKSLLVKTREKSIEIQTAIEQIDQGFLKIESCIDFRELMGLEGNIAKHYFKAYYSFANWKQREPRVKLDTINTTLDIGYTILFNFIETITRLFGFDPYMGIYHQLWFRRKSLVCDLMEPFRCIIDHQIRKSLKYGTFKSSDFDQRKGSYYLKPELNRVYSRVFFEAIIAYKSTIFKYTQAYYRCFMGRKSVTQYPIFYYE